MQLANVLDIGDVRHLLYQDYMATSKSVPKLLNVIFETEIGFNLKVGVMGRKDMSAVMLELLLVTIYQLLRDQLHEFDRSVECSVRWLESQNF